MASDTLVSLAILKTDLDEGRRDYFTYIEQLVAPILQDWGDEPLSDSLVARQFEKEYGLRVPDRAMQLVLRRFAKKGYLRRENKTYHVSKEIPETNLEVKRHEAIQKIDSLVQSIQRFIEENYALSWSSEEATSALVSFLGQFGIEFLRAYVFRTALPDIPDTTPRNQYLVGSYIRYAHETDKGAFDSVILFVKGQMYANALTCPDLEGLEKNFRGVQFYLDTPLVLGLLNVQGEQDFSTMTELVRLVQRLKGEVVIFEHTAAELEAVLNGAADNIENPDAFGRVVHEMRNRGLKRGDVLLKLESYEAELKAYGIKVRPTPDYDERFQISEEELKESIERQVQYRNPRALDFDINSIRAIFVLRQGYVPRRLEDARAVLVTNNSALSAAAYEVGKNHNSAREVSVAITDFSLANVAWLKSPMDAPDLPLKETLAACYAAIEPGAGLWSKYLRVLDTLAEQGTISPDHHAMLRVSGLAERELMELTLGDESELTGDTITAIQKRVIEEISQEHAAAVIEEKSAHEETRRKLRSAEVSRALSQARIENAADKIVGIGYGFIAIILATGLFFSLLAASGLVDVYSNVSPMIKAAAVTLVLLGILWGVYSSFVGANIRNILSEWKRKTSRSLSRKLLHWIHSDDPIES